MHNHSRQKLAGYQADADRIKDVIDQKRVDVRRGYLTLRKGILMEQARLSWCDEAIIMLEQDLAD